MTSTVAATSTNLPTNPTVWFAGLAVIVTLGYAAACWVKPFTHCHRCAGTGDAPRRLFDRLRYGPKPQPRAARARPTCPRCRGTGLRLRIGRRVFNRLHRIHRDATRR